MTRPRLARALVFAVVAAALAPLAAQVQKPRPSFRTDTDLVLVDAVVVDRDGQPVADLTAADFEVRDEGARQDIELFQAVHADDLADAYWRVLDRRAGGAFNIAAAPVLTPPRIARALGMRGAVRVPLRLLRGLVTLTWRLRLQPTDAGWIDIAARVPVMRTDRARWELGWEPRHTAEDALRELVGGFADGANVPASGPLQG